MTISVLILTYNEEVNIADCLRSVSWSNDVVVLDSFSTDQTSEIARSLGACVAQRRFDDYASQRNFGLSELRYRNPWVLMLDADERVPADLRDEMLHAVDTVPSDVCLLRMRRRDHLYGRWIRRSSGYPTWFGRLARIGRVWAERPYNEEIKTNGQVASLSHHLDHYPFNKGFHEWIMKHDRYSSMEAALLARGATSWRWRQLLAADPGQRRVAAKGVLYSMPCRPALVFLGLYIARGGIFEGRAGLTFCMLRSWYEFMINCKYRELQRRAHGLAV
jgi:glycosyltransferase involved in cell wall biosynthesis